MKLTTMTQVTVDGVMQGNGGASDEDRRDGFERGRWAGRRTYELFAGYWGAEERARAAAEDPGNHQITDALNTKPKSSVMGSGELIQTLMRHDLTDEYLLLTCPGGCSQTAGPPASLRRIHREAHGLRRAQPHLGGRGDSHG